MSKQAFDRLKKGSLCLRESRNCHRKPGQKTGMNRAYPLLLEKKGKGYAGKVPDFGLSFSGTDYAGMMQLAREKIGQRGMELIKKGQLVPLPSSLEEVQESAAKAKKAFVTLVDVDFDLFIKRHENRTVRRNVSLPAWLDQAASEAGINVSALLQRALKKELDV